MKNHNARPTGAAAFPEANANFGYYRGRGRRRGRHNNSGRGGNPRRGGHNNYSQRGGYNNFGPHKNIIIKNHKKLPTTPAKGNKGPPNNPTTSNDVCYKCGESGHWSRICRASKQKVEQYQASIRTAETNLLEEWENSDIPSGYTIGNTHLDCSDFFQDEDGEHVTNETFNMMLGDPPTSV